MHEDSVRRRSCRIYEGRGADAGGRHTRWAGIEGVVSTVCSLSLGLLLRSPRKRRAATTAAAATLAAEMPAPGRERRAHQRLVRRRAMRPIRGDFARRPSTPAVARMRSATRWGVWHGTQLGALEGRRVLVAVERFRKCIFFCFTTCWRLGAAPWRCNIPWGQDTGERRGRRRGRMGAPQRAQFTYRARRVTLPILREFRTLPRPSARAAVPRVGAAAVSAAYSEQRRQGALAAAAAASARHSA